MPAPPGVITTSRSPGGISWKPLPFKVWPDQGDEARLAVLAAVAAARRIIDAVERRQKVERLGDAAFDLHDLAEPAAGAAGAARIGAEFLAPEDQRVWVSAISTGVPRTPLG